MTPVEVIAQSRLAAHEARWGAGSGSLQTFSEEAGRDLAALASEGLVVVSAELLDALTDPDECWFDHHGGCQAHGFLSLEPGERCPQVEAQELLAALPERRTETS